MDFSRGFQTTQFETVLFVTLTASAIVALIVAQIVRARRQRQATPRAPRPDAAELTGDPRRRKLRELAVRDELTFRRISWVLKNPDTRVRLVDDPTLLVKASKSAIREGIVAEPDVIRLFNKLEVDAQPLRHRSRSSHTLPVGTEVSIADRTLTSVVGTVERVTPTEIAVKAGRARKKLIPGSVVEVVASSRRGIYRFHTLLAGVEGKTLTLRHANQIEYIQRRTYPRRIAALPVDVTRVGLDTAPMRSSTVDISLGGMALRNPSGKLGPGVRVMVELEPGRANPIVAEGIVIRLDRKHAHLRFVHVDEQMRHRIVRRLMQLSTAS